MKSSETKNGNNFAGSSADMERNTGNGAHETKTSKRFNSPVRITIRSIRNRLADPDGISAKAAIDGLVKANVLFDDSHHFVKEVIYQQEKVKKGETERTIIVVEEV